MNTRQTELLQHLLETEHYQTTKELADTFQVSERTIQTDLNQIEQFLNQQEPVLSLERKKGTGILLIASHTEKKQLKKQVTTPLLTQPSQRGKDQERLIFHLLMAKEAQSLEELAEKTFVARKEVKLLLEEIKPLLAHYCLTLVSKPRIGTFVEGSERKKRELLAKNLKAIHETDPETMLLKDFFSKEILSLIQGILREELAHVPQYTSSELSSIDIHIYFMLERMWQEETVILSTEEHQIVNNTLAQELSSQILARLANVYPVVFSTNEIDYLALRLMNVLTKNTVTSPLQGSATKLTYDLIEQVSQWTGCDFTQDEALKENLLAHLSSSYFRIHHGFSIANPLTKDILSTYTHLFLIIQMALEDYFSDEEFYFPQEEIAYLTVHFQAALERNKQKKIKRFRATLVSQYTRAMATFLEARLQREIPELTIDHVLQMEEEYSLEHESDVILSTIPLSKQTAPVLVISPLITKEDLTQIRQFMVAHEPKKQQKNFAIERFTSPFLIHPQAEFSDVTTLLTTLGNSLIAENLVKSEFLTSLLDREQRASTQVAPLIAIPHGDPRFVKTSTLSIVTLKQPLDWHGEQVQLVFLLAVKSEQLKEPAFKKFFSMVHSLEKNPDHLKQVLNEKNPLELMNLLTRYE